MNRLLETIAPAGRQASFRLSGSGAALVGRLLHGLVLFIFVAAAARAAKFETLTFWLDEIVGLLANLIGGVSIVLTTVTDIAGFFSFLGIAAMLSAFL